MNISHASAEHFPKLHQLDSHIAETELRSLIAQKRILILEDNGDLHGWLRWNLFWDNTPFMNMLFVVEPRRGEGLGRRLVLQWEEEMRQLGYESVMTSTASDEYAQHFYRKLGYETIGGFTPFGDPYELILAKKLC